jgi:alkanesulfonate monooxygenase SsuD/methylene tetrahydromethanopterin reductase-like flavin-dependent oxidoreductase (luciferase family)
MAPRWRNRFRSTPDEAAQAGAQRRVQFGVHIGPQDCTVAELRELSTWLDSNGVDWISVWDHLYEAPSVGGTRPHYEAVALLGALAADTTSARLGCLVFCASYRNIGMLAKSAMSIDHISGGRFELGVGSGWYDAEAQASGSTSRARAHARRSSKRASRHFARGAPVNVSPATDDTSISTTRR